MFRVRVVGWLSGALMLMFGAVALHPCLGGQDQDKAQAQRLEKLRADGAKAAITILPVFMMEKPNREVADAIGLTLEKVGLENLTATDTAFTPPADTAWEQLPAALGEFVRKNAPTAGYVLFAEFVGTPQTGPQEVRFVIVDMEGALVLADRQTPADADFKKFAAADPDPLGCSVLVAERVRKLLKLPPPAEPAREGKFAQLWAKKSGTPTEGERTAMKKAQERFKAAQRGANLLIFPTRMGSEVSAEHAQRLAEASAKDFGCQARVADTPFKVDIAPSHNEQRLLWDLARAFRDHVRQTHPDADYVLLADYYLAPEGPVGAVHFVVCDRTGEWVIVDFQNNQHEDFQRINPKSADDCDRLVVRRLGSYLR
jgi:hypothetical protein